MFDTMTATKAVAGFCIALLVLMVGGWFAGALFFSGGHHDEHHEWAYLAEFVPGEGGETAEPEPAEPEMSFAEAFAQANADDGSRAWRKCSACHKLADGANGTGPHLHALLGREIASAAGFAYSDAMLAHAGEVWEPENLSAWLADPNAFAPGNKMGNSQAVDDVQDRADLIAYIQQGE